MGDAQVKGPMTCIYWTLMRVAYGSFPETKHRAILIVNTTVQPVFIAS